MIARVAIIAVVLALGVAAVAWASFTSTATMTAVVPADHVARWLNELSQSTDTGSGSLSGYLKRGGSNSYAATGRDSSLTVNLGAIGSFTGSRTYKHIWSIKALAPLTVRVQTVPGSVSLSRLTVSPKLERTKNSSNGTSLSLSANERAWVNLTLKVDHPSYGGDYTTVRVQLGVELANEPAGFLTYQPPVGLTFTSSGDGNALPNGLAPAAPPWSPTD